MNHDNPHNNQENYSRYVLVSECIHIVGAETDEGAITLVMNGSTGRTGYKSDEILMRLIHETRVNGVASSRVVKEFLEPKNNHDDQTNQEEQTTEPCSNPSDTILRFRRIITGTDVTYELADYSNVKPKWELPTPYRTMSGPLYYKQHDNSIIVKDYSFKVIMKPGFLCSQETYDEIISIMKRAAKAISKPKPVHEFIEVVITPTH